MCKKPSPEEIFGPKLTEEEVMRMIQKTPGLYFEVPGAFGNLEVRVSGVLHGGEGAEPDL